MSAEVTNVAASVRARLRNVMSGAKSLQHNDFYVRWALIGTSYQRKGAPGPTP